MMDFSAGRGQSTGSELIPNGLLVWAVINVRGIKTSQKGSRYLDVELTIDEGQPYARRKIWEMIGDPFYDGNTPEYKQMGMVAISRILEAARGAHLNPQLYRLNDFAELNGLRCAIRVGISKGTGGYDDKNRVGAFLTPDPTSDAYKEFQMLTTGQHFKNKPAAGATVQQPLGGFGQQAHVQQPSQHGFQQPGFQQPAQAQGSFAQTVAGQPTQTGFAGTQDPAASHSDFGSPNTPAGNGNSQPSWLQQANGN